MRSLCPTTSAIAATWWRAALILAVALGSSCLSFELDDADSDGYSPAEGDCDDSTAQVYPGADGVSGDCGVVGSDDTELASTPVDQDGDGYSAGEGDCDDSNPTVYPEAPEILDGLDNDCDHAVDEGLGLPPETPAPTPSPMPFPTPQLDEDGDGFTVDEGDCDDNDPATYPGATEQYDNVDHDCDGSERPQDDWATPSPAVDQDQDRDQDGFSIAQGDCDDNDPTTYPTASEVTDGTDNDCDGEIDEDTEISMLQDGDGDGFSADEGDCDDGDPAIYPNAKEVEDGLDNDCNDLVDDLAVVVVGDVHEDDDGDGYTEADGDCDDSDATIYPSDTLPVAAPGDCRATTEAGDGTSDRDQDGFSVQDGDCDDYNNTVHPGAPEQCNGNDDDCDGEVDEDLPVGTYYVDADGDGYGVSSSTRVTCMAAPKGFAYLDGDCNDQNPEVHPGALEQCNGVDDDCDREVDETDADSDATTAGVWYADTDGDGFGDPDTATVSCYPPPGYVAEGSDCDDTSADTYPGAEEKRDLKDNDCDGEIDEQP